MQLNNIGKAFARCHAIAVRAIKPASRQSAELLQGRPLRIINRLLLIMAIGGFMGFLGPALAQASQHPQWGNILSGALGALGAFGFEFLARWTALLQPS